MRLQTAQCRTRQCCWRQLAAGFGDLYQIGGVSSGSSHRNTVWGAEVAAEGQQNLLGLRLCHSLSPDSPLRPVALIRAKCSRSHRHTAPLALQDPPSGYKRAHGAAPRRHSTASVVRCTGGLFHTLCSLSVQVGLEEPCQLAAHCELVRSTYVKRCRY